MTVGSGHVPVRTCVGCRERDDKRGLVRFVAVAGRATRVGASGSVVGRGAYVHRDPGCVAAALKGGGLARALRTRVDAGEAVRLQAEIGRTTGL
jgi:uncharacterized protein